MLATSPALELNSNPVSSSQHLRLGIKLAVEEGVGPAALPFESKDSVRGTSWSPGNSKSFPNGQRRADMAGMKVAQISKAGGPFEIVERDIPQPGPGQVRIKVEACGVCHSDSLVKEALYPGLQLPRVPGHEISGRIDAVGTGARHGSPDSGWAWDGMAGTASSA